MNKQQEPRLRFKGFTGAWEEKKLEDIFYTIRNAFVGTATPYYVENGHFYLESNNIKNGEINKKSQIFINDEFYYKQQDKWLKTNDLVMVQSGHVGHCAVIPEELNNVAAHALIMFSNYKLEANPYFLSYQFQTNRKINEIAKITTGNTIKHILSSDMKEFTVDFPMVEEQTHLGLFFRRLDSQIAESRAVLEKSRQLKKAMLAKMFPANGEKIPKIRFKGFEGEWECRKLGEVANFTKGSGYSKSDLTEEGFPIILYGRLYTQYETVIKNVDTFVSFDKKALKSLGNEVIVPASGETSEDIARASVVYQKGVILGGDLNVITPNKNIDSAFLALSLTNGKCNRELAKKAQGKSVVHLHNSDLQECEILFPFLKEQTAIGNFFRQLDETIALQSAEIEKLNQLKKGLLAAMLV